MNVWPVFQKKASGEIARKRLKLLLLSDKTDYPPEILEKMKDDMIRVISKYMEIEADGIEIQILGLTPVPSPRKGPVLRASIPLCSSPKPFCVRQRMHHQT